MASNQEGSATWSEAKEELVSQFFGLTYRISEEMLSHLEHVGLPHVKDNGKRLGVFLEVVAFVVFWADRAGRKRAFGSNKEIWEHIVKGIRNTWEAFFSDYPNGPTFKTVTGQDIGALLSQRSSEYGILHQSTLQKKGVLEAQNSCSLAMIRHAWPHIKKEEISGDVYEVALHHMGTVIQQLIRHVDAVIVTRPWKC